MKQARTRKGKGKKVRTRKPPKRPAPKAPLEVAIPFPGFPSITFKVWEEVLDLLRAGRGLVRICREHPEYPIRTVFLKAVATGTAEQKDTYARAMDDGADAKIEEADDIADDGRNDTYLDKAGNVKVNHDVIQRSKLRVEQRRWHASKLRPKKYGDRIQVEEVKPPISDEELNRRIAEKTAILQRLLDEVPE